MAVRVVGCKSTRYSTKLAHRMELPRKLAVAAAVDSGQYKDGAPRKDT